MMLGHNHFGEYETDTYKQAQTNGCEENVQNV